MSVGSACAALAVSSMALVNMINMNTIGRLQHKQSPEERIKRTELYVPHEVLQDRYKNRPSNGGIETFYNKDGSEWRKTEYGCGCVVDECLDTYGNGHQWCDEHAPTTHYLRRDEVIPKQMQNKFNDKNKRAGVGSTELGYRTRKSSNHKGSCEDLDCEGCA